ncbi:MAG TPA: hypothetical protein VIC54_03685 [Terriglobales bacterium]
MLQTARATSRDSATQHLEKQCKLLAGEITEGKVSRFTEQNKA